MFKLIFLLLCATVFGYRNYCDEKSVLRHIGNPTYDFSVRILDRIAQETDGHFVFSPISTWLQLVSLIDGAKGETLNQIEKVTRYRRVICLRKFVGKIFHSLNQEVKVTMQHGNIIVVDNLLNVKRSFIRNVDKLFLTKVVLVDFRNKNNSADKINDIIKAVTNGIINGGVDADDFNNSVLLMIDAACTKANWRMPFNPVYTKAERFFSYEKVPIGMVNMMHQIGYFNTTFISRIDAHVLELPFNDRLSMLLFLPNKGTAADLFWSMKTMRLSTIMRLLEYNKPQLISVKVPRFEVTTDMDNTPELLHDMGLEKIFIPRAAELGKISKYKLYVSMMINKAHIEVNETGVLGNVGPELLVTAQKTMDIVFNQPFAYIVADKTTKVILFAGIYSEPSLV